MREQARSMVTLSLAEPGCLSWNYLDPDDPRSWVVVEEWEPREDLRGAPGRPAPGALAGAYGPAAGRPAGVAEAAKSRAPRPALPDRTRARVRPTGAGATAGTRTLPHPQPATPPPAARHNPTPPTSSSTTGHHPAVATAKPRLCRRAALRARSSRPTASSRGNTAGHRRLLRSRRGRRHTSLARGVLRPMPPPRCPLWPQRAHVQAAALILSASRLRTQKAPPIHLGSPNFVSTEIQSVFIMSKWMRCQLSQSAPHEALWPAAASAGRPRPS
ncbi:putative quinol monooxygenase [Streptomyces sp. BHT-5-2]|uniref:putative quinol monooxygenase n=1 Tax=Streptomyces sp. BHT-5-2 TaxID=2866715 RepID=UPI0037DA323A